MGASLTANVDTASASALLTLDWNATNYATNPHFRTASSTSDWRTNNFINPIVSANTTGWSQANQGVGTTTGTREVGSGLSFADSFYRQTWTAVTTGAIASTGILVGTSASDQIVAVAAMPLTVSAYVRSSHADRTAALTMTFHDAAGAQLSVVTGSTVAVGAGWTRLSVSAVAPANSVRAFVRCYAVGGTVWAVNDTFDVTAVLADYTSALLPYFDGSSALTGTETAEGFTRVWTGAAHASTSATRLPNLFTTGPFSAYQQQSATGGRVLTESEYRQRIIMRQALTAGNIFMFSWGGLVNTVAGETWSWRFQVRQIAATQDVAVYARCGAYNAGSGSVGTGATGSTVVVPADGSWVTVDAPTYTMPANAATSRLLVYVTNGTTPAGTQFEFRRVQVEKTSATLGPYFDGSSAGFHWNGTADASTSSINATTSATIARVNTVDGSILGVRNAEPATLVAGQWIGQDYEVPLDDGFYYRATSPDAPGYELLSATYSVASSGRTMLKHPGRPSLNASVRVESAPNLSRPVTQGTFEVLGRQTPVAVSMRRSSARGELALTTYDESERSALLLLLDDGTPLLLQTPTGYGLGNVYVSVGDVAEERVSPQGYAWERRWTLPFVIVDRPVGAALAVGNTWADVLAAYSSWDAMRTAEGTWAGVLEGLGS